MNYELAQRLDEYVKQNHYRLLNSVLIYRGGELIVERYYNKFTENSRNNIKSIWKSILSVCTGIAIDKGFIKSVDEPISTYLPLFDGRNNSYHPLITVKYLLTMSSGIYWNGGIHYHCPMLDQFNRSKNQLEFLADIKMDTLPGTKNLYKEWDVILLSAVLSASTGINTFDFCNEYLYKPLGIESGRWWTYPCGLCYNIGDTTKADNRTEQAKSDLSARALGKIGFLFKQGGIWQGGKIVSSEYVKEALIPSECNPNYGYMWWLSDEGYGCSGYGGQKIQVLPEKDIVYVIQATPLNTHRDYSDAVYEIIHHL